MSCQACNLLKTDQSVPDPVLVFTRRTVSVKQTGVMQGKTGVRAIRSAGVHEALTTRFAW